MVNEMFNKLFVFLILKLFRSICLCKIYDIRGLLFFFNFIYIDK